MMPYSGVLFLLADLADLTAPVTSSSLLASSKLRLASSTTLATSGKPRDRPIVRTISSPKDLSTCWAGIIVRMTSDGRAQSSSAFYSSEDRPPHLCQRRVASKLLRQHFGSKNPYFSKSGECKCLRASSRRLFMFRPCDLACCTRRPVGRYLNNGSLTRSATTRDKCWNTLQVTSSA